MFKIIEPKYHCFYTSLIERFVDSLKLSLMVGAEFSDSLQNKTTFILREDTEKGVYGGAMLFKTELSDFPKEFSEPVSHFLSLNDLIWKCIISISFEDDSSLCRTGDVEGFCQNFYRCLYESLAEFGQKGKVGCLAVTLDPGEYLCTEGAIFWPYVFELKPQISSDGFFYGILPLKGIQYEAYKRVWEALDLSSAERRLTF